MTLAGENKETLNDRNLLAQTLKTKRKRQAMKAFGNEMVTGLEKKTKTRTG